MFGGKRQAGGSGYKWSKIGDDEKSMAKVASTLYRREGTSYDLCSEGIFLSFKNEIAFLHLTYRFGRPFYEFLRTKQ